MTPSVEILAARLKHTVSNSDHDRCRYHHDCITSDCESHRIEPSAEA